MKRREAAPSSFGVGEFELIEERVPDNGTEPAEAVRHTPARNDLVQLTRRSNGAPLTRDGRIPPALEVCRACNQYIWPGETTCPHCSANLQEAAESYEQDRRRREELIAEVTRLVEAARASVAALPSHG